MAYGHLFYGYYNYPDGTTVYVNIYKDGYTGDAYRIAHMQGLSLEIGGGEDPIYTPVVKTTLRFSMADAFDIGSPHYSGGEFQDCVTGTGPYDKHGRWESFYTSNPTELKVELQVNNTVIWTGFVTPDSWEEAMIYRGSITVVARDMLGTLSDRPFDATGTNGCISVIDLVNGAIQASQGAMSVIYAVSKFLYNKTDGSSLLNALIPVASFEGKSWWDALTGTLEALGLVLRYNGANKLQLLSIRYIHETGFNAAHDSEFINRTGLRTLDPPVKEIAGEFELDIISKALTPPSPNKLHACIYTAQTVMLGTKSTDKGHPWGGNRPTVQPYELYERSGDWYWGDESQSRPPLFSPPSPAGVTIAQNGINLAGVYFIANTGFCDDTKYTFIKRYGYTPTWEGVIEAPTRLTIRQDGAILMRDSSGNLQVPVLNDPEMADAGLGPWLEEVSIYIKDEESGKYYDGSGNWINGTEKTLSSDTSGIDPITLNFGGSNSEVGIDIPLPAGTTSNQLSLVVIVAHVLVLAEHVTLSSVKGLFAPLTFDISKPEAVTMPTEYSVRTVYNENYNVAISRNPALGCINTPLTGKIFKNVLLSLNNGRPYPLPDSWNWGSGTGTGYPLEVMVQAQLLMLYASAMSIFTGDIHDKGTEFAPEPFAKPGYRFLYFARNCLLLRGTFDFVSGFIRGSALREYATWEQIWSSFNPQYNTQESGDAGPSSPGSSSGSGGSSGGGGGGGGTGTVTSVDMTVPTGFTIGGNPITVAGTLALGFATGYSLPLTADVNKGVTAYGWGNHAQAGYLTGITSTMVINALGYTPQAQIANLDLLWARANHGQEAYGWGNHANAGYASQTDLDDLAEVVADLGSPYFIITPQVTIGSRWEPLSGGGAKFGTYIFINHPKLGTAGYEWILMRRSKRGRKKTATSAPHFDIRRSGWSEAIGQGEDESSYNWDPLTGTAKYVDLDTLRDFIMRRFVCTYDWQLSNWRNSAYLLDILKDPRAIDPTDRDYTELRFGQTFPMGSGGSHSVTREKWRTMTRVIAQFGIAIRRVNPEFLEHYNPQQTLAKTTRQISYLDGAVRKTVDRYLYSEVVPLRCFINKGLLAGTSYTTWHLGFRLQDI